MAVRGRSGLGKRLIMFSSIHILHFREKLLLKLKDEKYRRGAVRRPELALLTWEKNVKTTAVVVKLTGSLLKMSFMYLSDCLRPVLSINLQSQLFNLVLRRPSIGSRQDVTNNWQESNQTIKYLRKYTWSETK